MTRTFGLRRVALSFGLLFAVSASAQEPIRFARTPDISPDGRLVAFSYLGDLWVVETIGGTARAITSHPAHDVYPVFSPDGRFIAFSSNRHGSYDVYVVPSYGGRPKRLTTDSSSDIVCGWSADGKQVLFASTRNTAFPPSYELYTVSAEGGQPRRVSAAEGKEGAFSPTGDLLAYVRGPGTWYRKGYRGSSNDDIWVCNADGSNNRRFTDFNGQDGSPMWSADGRTIFYVSEYFGTPANIVKKPADSSQGVPPVQVTQHTEDGVRRARISHNGEWIVYECGPELWVVGTRDGAKPRKLAIEVFADDKANPERVETFTRGANEFVPSPDEKHVAFAVHGNLFLQSIALQPGKAVRLTETSANDHGIAWAPDGSKILFLSDRDGKEDIYLLQANDPEHPKFVEAHQFKVTRLTDTPDAEVGLSFTPDGKRVGFLRSGKLWTMKPDGSDQKVLVDDVHVFDYEWSPDSKWVVYARRDGSFASELYVIPSTGATKENPARNITRYATFNGDMTWSADGRMICFLSERRGPANLFVLPLQKPAGQGVSERPASVTFPVVDFDWDDLHLRARAAAPVTVSEAAISPDGSKVAFRANNQGEDLWVASTTGGHMTRLTTGGQNPHQIRWSRRRSPFGGTADVIYYLDGNGSIRMARPSSFEIRSGLAVITAGSTPVSPLPMPSGGESITIPFKVTMTIRNEDLYREMFDQSWRYLSEHFYDAKFHGHNWDAIRAKYRPLVEQVALKEDLYALLYLMLGELNASHLGIAGFNTRPDQVTADLGLIFDDTYHGKGLKISEVLKRGPADRRGLKIKAGEYVLAVDGVELNESTELSKLLNDKSDESVTIQVATEPNAGAKDRRRVEIKPVKRDEIAPLMYERWVRKNAARVSELSKGKLGYIHIPSMDEEGLDRFVRALYSDNFDKEAIVLDVRYNGGGFTHDQVLNYLGGREHTYFRERDGGEGLVLRPYDRKWTKPLVLLINNRSYSDAEIFPNAFRTLGLGKLVGEPTAGFVIGTGVVHLVDGSMLRIPRIGVYTSKGVNMEKEGVRPDVLVEDHPDQLAKGVDVQLEKAVEVLQEDVIAFKKKAGGGVAAAARNPQPPPVSPSTPPAAPATGSK